MVGREMWLNLPPIVFDPNVRPAVLPDRDRYVAAVEKWVAISTVVKVSDDDLAWLYPGHEAIAVAKRWIEEGVAIVVITRGAAGLAAVNHNEIIEVGGVKVDVIDTVGAEVTALEPLLSRRWSNMVF